MYFGEENLRPVFSTPCRNMYLGLPSNWKVENFLVHCLMMKDHLYVVDPLYKANS